MSAPAARKRLCEAAFVSEYSAARTLKMADFCRRNKAVYYVAIEVSSENLERQRTEA